MGAYNNPTLPLGGISLKAAGLVASDTEHSAVRIQKAAFLIHLAWTACEIDSSNELYVVDVQAKNNSGSWVNIGTIGAFGKGSALGGRADSTSTGSVKAAFNNPFGANGEVRLATWVTGTIGTGFNFSATIHPAESLGSEG